ncbi:Iron-sulphur cluster biosynthesis [Nesidiocoris tenuis]|uniref:Iron-sulphur cluster biosynthesis n=1 Tax=Nesidiocoris tenuis TaxID=355587 RepID=A0ABN7A7J9_9HEMI|nr:Iron-sulphur cluster biosynthesis [Nesidiocoris tenuis]
MLLRRLQLRHTYCARSLVHEVPNAAQVKPLKLSESCVERLKAVSKPDESLRITVESGGCSGFQYNFELDDKISDDDVVVEENGARIVVDQTSLNFIEGAVVDYHSEMIKSSFRIVKNPKAEGGCSCGVSFSVKLD